MTTDEILETFYNLGKGYTRLALELKEDALGEYPLEDKVALRASSSTYAVVAHRILSIVKEIEDGNKEVEDTN